MDLTSSQCSADIGKLKAVEKVEGRGGRGSRGILIPSALCLLAYFQIRLNSIAERLVWLSITFSN